jgi:hypothetical protein
MVPHPDADADPGDGRQETPAERSDRHWAELLQELRVLQTGTQILTGFLLTLAFQQRFASLDAGQVALYLVLVVVAILATILGLAPVALHRSLFRRRLKEQLVETAHVLMLVTLGLVALVFAGTAALIFDVVIGPAAAAVAAVAALVVVAGLWIALPGALRRRGVAR